MKAASRIVLSAPLWRPTWRCEPLRGRRNLPLFPRRAGFHWSPPARLFGLRLPEPSNEPLAGTLGDASGPPWLFLLEVLVGLPAALWAYKVCRGTRSFCAETLLTRLYTVPHASPVPAPHRLPPVRPAGHARRVARRRRAHDGARCFVERVGLASSAHQEHGPDKMAQTAGRAARHRDELERTGDDCSGARRNATATKGGHRLSSRCAHCTLSLVKCPSLIAPRQGTLARRCFEPLSSGRSCAILYLLEQLLHPQVRRFLPSSRYSQSHPAPFGARPGPHLPSQASSPTTPPRYRMRTPRTARRRGTCCMGTRSAVQQRCSCSSSCIKPRLRRPPVRRTIPPPRPLRTKRSTRRVPAGAYKTFVHPTAQPASQPSRASSSRTRSPRSRTWSALSTLSAGSPTTTSAPLRLTSGTPLADSSAGLHRPRRRLRARHGRARRTASGSAAGGTRSFLAAKTTVCGACTTRGSVRRSPAQRPRGSG